MTDVIIEKSCEEPIEAILQKVRRKALEVVKQVVPIPGLATLVMSYVAQSPYSWFQGQSGSKELVAPTESVNTVLVR